MIFPEINIQVDDSEQYDSHYLLFWNIDKTICFRGST